MFGVFDVRSHVRSHVESMQWECAEFRDGLALRYALPLETVCPNGPSVRRMRSTTYGPTTCDGVVHEGRSSDTTSKTRCLMRLRTLHRLLMVGLS